MTQAAITVDRARKKYGTKQALDGLDPGLHARLARRGRVWPVALLAVFFPLAVRRFTRLSR
ncbi:hypothetical protein ACFYZ2_33435 [Streptomyces sviceus]|uniref:hypothetical protein n=1 Tax=Streptomyces sviceus TaxID=285530 RepID=UPI0036A0B47D